MTRWEHFERVFLDPLYSIAEGQRQTAGFTNEALARYLRIPSTEASALVQSYLDAQRGKRSKTSYVLRRKGRTKSAVWYVGVRTKDAKMRMGQFASDVKRNITRALKPDLRRIGERNPRALPAIEEGLEPAIDGFSQMVAAVFSMAGLDEES